MKEADVQKSQTYDEKSVRTLEETEGGVPEGTRQEGRHTYHSKYTIHRHYYEPYEILVTKSYSTMALNEKEEQGMNSIVNPTITDSVIEAGTLNLGVSPGAITTNLMQVDTAAEVQAVETLNRSTDYSKNFVDEEMRDIFSHHASIMPLKKDKQYNVKTHYVRLQIPIQPEHAALDNTSQENIEVLENYGIDLIRKNSKEIAFILDVLKDRFGSTQH
ncbi:hypothetical protein AWC38_SpisGene25348 [Stylophora pistillata]|uniref:Uncharacterized protein n=1 Tax=Stylophora pistillata TaxID=50429 RepID=A0A2B4R0B4_STYPI|nr:hypothetical protein AWC38_SpisGene25348 [Stylophora pistillata]